MDEFLWIRRDLDFLEGFVNALPLDNAARAIAKLNSIKENFKKIREELERLQTDSLENTNA